MTTKQKKIIIITLTSVIALFVSIQMSLHVGGRLFLSLLLLVMVSTSLGTIVNDYRMKLWSKSGVNEELKGVILLTVLFLLFIFFLSKDYLIRYVIHG